MTPPQGRQIVTLCGSCRFYEAFQKANYEETMKGHIVLSVGFYPGPPDWRSEHQESYGVTPEQKTALDALHRVHVLNVGGYIGESTTREIAWAICLNKALTFLEPSEGESFLSRHAHRIGGICAEHISRMGSGHGDRDIVPDGLCAVGREHNPGCVEVIGYCLCPSPAFRGGFCYHCGGEQRQG
jgi:hypothetical protein